MNLFKSLIIICLLLPSIALASIDSVGFETVNAVQSGTWTTGRTWSLLNTTDSVNAVQSGTWTTGRTWTLSSGTDSIVATQGTSPWASNISQFGGSNVVTGTGASGSGIPRVTVSNDSNVLVTQSTNPWIVSPVDGQRVTYSAAVSGLAVSSTATDIFTITGSATKTIRITQVIVSGTENTSAIREVVLIKRSTANSGGTSTSQTAVPHDSNSAAATATVLAYTVNPTLGTTVGAVRSAKFDASATNLVGATDRAEFNFGDRSGQAVVLRGTSQVLAVNLDGAYGSNPSVNVSIEWTEE